MIKKAIITLIVLSALGFGGVVATIFVRAPIAIPFLFAETYPEYFRTGIRTWQTERGAVGKWIPRLLSYKLYRDWLSYESRVATMTGDESLAVAINLREQVTTKVLTQKDVRFKSYEQVPYTTLVYGLAYCDGINFLYGDLIAQKKERVSLWSLVNRETNYSNHTLVRQSDEGRPDYYFDAWTSVPVFSIEQSHEGRIPVHTSLPEDFREKIRAQYVVEGRELYQFKRPPLNFGAWHTSWLDFGRGIDDDDFQSSPYVVYLKARILHLYGYTAEAHATYRKLAETGCSKSTEVFCQAAEAWAQKPSITPKATALL